jgi:hypothetical protein
MAICPARRGMIRPSHGLASMPSVAAYPSQRCPAISQTRGRDKSLGLTREMFLLTEPRS